MSTTKKPTRTEVILGWTLGLACCPVNALDFSQVPLFLSNSEKPNILLMLDNSGSMDTDVEITPEESLYNPNQAYLANSNCFANPLPANETRTVINNDIDRKECRRIGGDWNRRRGYCEYEQSVEITYDDSIPVGFFGYQPSRRSPTGTQCFDPNINYTIGLSIPNTVTTAAQKANYLNWYYSNQLAMTSTRSTRMAMAKTAAHTLIDALNENTRLGLATFNSPSGGSLWEVVDDLTETKKTNLKTVIDSINPSGWTPLAETTADIGQYFALGSSNVVLHSGTDEAQRVSTTRVLPSALQNRTNWSGRISIPGEPGFSTPPIQSSCQKSFTVMITDGLPTQDREIQSNNYLKDYDLDCSGTNRCGSYDMKSIYPYPDGESSDYWDDVTKALYEMDLRPDLRYQGEEAFARNNLTTYVIGFADETINPTMPGVNPLPSDAALQGGGKFYFAGNQTELSASLSSAFGYITQTSSSSSAVATNSTQYQTGAMIFQAIFDPSRWTGDLVAYSLETEDTNGNGQLDSGEDLNGNGKIDAGAVGVAVWNAAAKIPQAGSRSIYTWSESNQGSVGVPFMWDSLNATQQGILGSEMLVHYLRGDQSSEIDAGGHYRNRGVVLGDIVNSDPLYVGREDYGYAVLPGAEGASYTSFAGTDRREMIYVGANDGFLHAFDASNSIRGGQEIFAYLPNVLISTPLLTLSEPGYVHKYFVDGSAKSGDAYFNGAWHTVLVGTLGAGGKGLFALDITDPDDFDSTKVLWEYTYADNDDLGFTFSEPVIARLNNGKWGVIVGNGYGSANGKASLLILDVETGALIKQMDTSVVNDNGLSSPVAIDLNEDRIADYVYAGDLKGNVWKFDLSSGGGNSSAQNSWHIAYNGSPLFTAMDASMQNQPITAKPAVSKASATGQNNKGVMVYFGTGKYFETGDNQSAGTSSVQSFYGIWDSCDLTSASDCDATVFSRTLLQEQSIVSQLTQDQIAFPDGSSSNYDARLTSDCIVAYDDTVPTASSASCSTETRRKGWYIDLFWSGTGVTGERVVSEAIIRHGTVIFPTLIPEQNLCSAGGTSWLMELEQFSGSQLQGTPMDINEDGFVDENDQVLINQKSLVVSGIKSNVGITHTPAVINCEEGLDCKYSSGSSGERWLVKETAEAAGQNPGTGTQETGRQTWRQLR